jgi:UDP-N-acetylglucosamine--N-acetylmuramyl-(pentapeptide) pyrophosphoryl-undecaprenol N-acetylglucosamine transferase
VKLLIAGGGTGGHVFPALAVANTFMESAPDGEVLFVGTQHGIEARILPKTRFPVEFISIRGMRKTGFINNVRGFIELPLSILQSLRILKQFRPDYVLGVGGYASGPTLAAAILKGIPTAIQEQNSVMGTTNRILSRFVQTIFTSWETTEPCTCPSKTICVGNPIRSEIQNNQKHHKNSEKHLLIFGGSRGAHNINKAFFDDLPLLQKFSSNLKIIHQTGREDIDQALKKYKEAGLDAELREFIDDMNFVYNWADLIVCRAGASSLAEITALGKPAIVIPYPYAIGDHQSKNADVLYKLGAVQIIPDSQLQNGRLINAVVNLLDNPEELSRMAKASLLAGKPKAASLITREIIRSIRESLA